MEQDLVESLIVESISIYGHSVYYCPRTLINRDDIYNEDSLSQYKTTYNVDMYITSYDSYEGDGTFLSKFNLEIRDQIRFVIANRTFFNEIALNESLIRPQEGDLIYSPMMKRLFVIKYVNNKPIFYQMGALQTFELTCEVFEYSNEKLNTGIAEIDDIEVQYSFAGEGNTVIANTAYANTLGIYETNSEFETEGEDIIDWSHIDPFSSGTV